MILARLLRLFEKQAKEHVHDVTAAVGLDGAHVCPGGVLCGVRPAHMVQSEQGEAPALTSLTSSSGKAAVAAFFITIDGMLL